MQLNLFRQFEYGSSMCGWMNLPGQRLMTLERSWNQNVPRTSCVRAGFYHLVPHHGTKYTDTWALVGESVSHLPGEGKRRSACVLHWEDDAKFLLGCISFGLRLGMVGDEYKLYDNKVGLVLEALADSKDYNYLTIHDPMRGPYTAKDCSGCRR